MRCRLARADRLCSSLLLLVCSTLGCALTAPGVAAAEDAQQATRELAQVERAMGDINDWLALARQRQSQQEQRLQEAELRVAEIAPAVASLRERIVDAEARRRATQERQVELEQSREAQNAQLRLALRAAYVAGNRSPLQILLNQEDLSDSARLLHYARLFSEAQLDRIADYEQTLEALNRSSEELDEVLAELRERQAELDQEQMALAEAQRERASVLESLNAEIASRQDELGRLARSQAELQSLIEEITRAMAGIDSFADVPPFAEQRGQLPLPVTGSLRADFGSAYGGGNLRRQGVTIDAPPGSEVRAIHAGRVVFADWLRGAGLLVIVDHGDGYMSLYGGNQALATEAGQWVDVGDGLANSGTPTSGDRPGLYFEIRHQGEPQNPSNWLQ